MPELSPSERIARGYQLSADEARKKVKEHIKKCELKAASARKILDSLNNAGMPPSFEESEKLRSNLEALKGEYKDNMDIVARELRKVGDKDFERHVNEHFSRLNDVIQLSERERKYLRF